LSGKAYIKVKVMFKFIVSFLLLLISFNVKSQDNLENINVLEEVIKIVDSQEQIFYLKKIKGLKKSDRLFLRIANGRFYIKENEVEDFSGNISKEGRKLDSLILSKKEIEKLLLNLKKQTVWEDNLFENSIALLGAFAIMNLAGMSINVLSMFAMVLVIGIVVDDAIVVVENVERIMAEERLSPLEATKKAMSQIQGAVIGITVVLVSVFIPMAFFTGTTGNIYRQFSLVMAVSILFSAFLALSLTPALCGTLLKPVDKDHHVKKGFFGKFFNGFNRVFDRNAKRYESFVGKLLRRAGRIMVIYLVLIGVAAFVMTRIPTGFLPNEDQGFAIEYHPIASWCHHGAYFAHC
jgi:competence protein ComGC